MRTKLALLGTLMLAMAAPAAAGWQEDISAFDRQRLSHLEESRTKALAEAEAGGNAADLREIHAVLAGPRGDISAADLKGNWRCRVHKLGGISPTRVYRGWVRCRVQQTHHGLFFEKLGGAWRVSGYLDRYDGKGWVLLGGLSTYNDRQVPYSGGTDGAGAQATSNDAIGIITKAGAGHVRIEFPYPVVESHFDIIEMKR
jgi:hypothetical protein